MYALVDCQQLMRQGKRSIYPELETDFFCGVCFAFANQIFQLKKLRVTKDDHTRYMQMAVDLSQYALDSKSGGPFGAIIVKDGKIIGSSGNQVLKNCDPTAHAEVMAIRDACKNIESCDLSGCDIYSSAEPCPLCTAAIYWSKIQAVYYSNTEDDSMKHGFIDKEILKELQLPKEKRNLLFKQVKNPQALGVFRRALESF